MANEEIEALSYNERCAMLNLNPVVVAKHFQHRVENFFSVVLLSNLNPIGNLNPIELPRKLRMILHCCSHDQ